MKNKLLIAVIITVILLLSLKIINVSIYTKELENKLEIISLEANQNDESFFQNSLIDNSNDLDWILKLDEYTKVLIENKYGEKLKELELIYNNIWIDAENVIKYEDSESALFDKFNLTFIDKDKTYTITIISDLLIKYNNNIYRVDHKLLSIYEAVISQPDIINNISMMNVIYNADLVLLDVQGIPFYYFNFERSRKVVNSIENLISKKLLYEVNSSKIDDIDFIE